MIGGAIDAQLDADEVVLHGQPGSFRITARRADTGLVYLARWFWSSSRLCWCEGEHGCATLEPEAQRALVEFLAPRSRNGHSHTVVDSTPNLTDRLAALERRVRDLESAGERIIALEGKVAELRRSGG